MATRTDTTIDAAEFAAHCSDILTKLGDGTLQRMEITKAGKVIAIVTPPPHVLFGFLRGTVTIPEGFDLTAPVFDGKINAEEGIIHE